MNPVNYVRGLFDELDAAETRGDTDHQAAIHFELAAHIPAARRQFPRDLAYTEAVLTVPGDNGGRVVQARELVELRTVGDRMDAYSPPKARGRGKNAEDAPPAS